MQDALHSYKRMMMLGNHTRAALVGALVAIICVVAYQTAWLQPLELAAYDALIASQPSVAGAPIVVVEVTERDIQDIGRWPLTDQALANALNLIENQQPRVIGLDIYRDLPVPPGTGALQSVLRRKDNIVAVYRFTAPGEAAVSAPVRLRGTDQEGFNDIVVDPDGVVRRGLVFLTGDRAGPAGSAQRVTGNAFSFQIAIKFLAVEGVVPSPDPRNSSFLRLGKTTIPPLEANRGAYTGIDASGYQYLLDYRDALLELPRYRIADVLNERTPNNAFTDKIVLIGTNAVSVPDVLRIPAGRAANENHTVPGVYVHGHSVAQLIRYARGVNEPRWELPQWVEWGWTSVWCLIGAFLGLHTRSALWALACSALSACALALAAWGAFRANGWIPVSPPLLGMLLSGGLVAIYKLSVETAQRRTLMNLFSRHVDPKIADSIWADRDMFLRGGRPSSASLTATVMFTDLHSFTTTSEKLSPGDLMEWLNEYMEVMTPIVGAHDGVILRFIGDAIMAVFGAPVPRTNEKDIDADAINAVRCALEMEKRLIEHNRSLTARGLPPIGMRLGIYTGPMVGGSLGSEHRLEYNIHGDNVNTAARLESYDKTSFEPDYLRSPCRILIGEPTRERLTDEFSTTLVGVAALKGKSQEVTIYRVANPDA